MFKSTYLLRLDDACPTMDRAKWQQMEIILDRYGIKPMVGVIPHNEDPAQLIEPADDCFWAKVKMWDEKGWAISMHGYNHCYCSEDGLKGINPMWKRSEFSGLPLDAQQVKIRKGVSIMRDQGINPKYFFAPSHTFDYNTLVALRKESDIRIISDTIGRYPYEMHGFYFIPQIFGHFVKIPCSGIFTFCFHPNTMTDSSFKSLECFLRKWRKSFIPFSDINTDKCGKKGTIDKLLSNIFYTYRNIRGLN